VDAEGEKGSGGSQTCVWSDTMCGICCSLSVVDDLSRCRFSGFGRWHDAGLSRDLGAAKGDREKRRR
jgi:hypothetical protein